MKRLICFLLIVLSLFVTGCSDANTYKKTQVRIKDFNNYFNYIYVTEFGDNKLVHNTYYIEYDDKLKTAELKVDDILELEYKVKENAAVPIIKVKSFKVLISAPYEKMHVIIKNISDRLIYVAEIESEEVTRRMYNIEHDDNLKNESLEIGDILEVEYQIKERSNPPIIKVKSFKILTKE